MYKILMQLFYLPKFNVQKKISHNSIHFHYVAILALPKEPVPEGFMNIIAMHSVISPAVDIG